MGGRRLLRRHLGMGVAIISLIVDLPSSPSHGWRSITYLSQSDPVAFEAPNAPPVSIADQVEDYKPPKGASSPLKNDYALAGISVDANQPTLSATSYNGYTALWPGDIKAERKATAVTPNSTMAHQPAPTSKHPKRLAAYRRFHSQEGCARCYDKVALRIFTGRVTPFFALFSHNAT